MDRTIDHLHCHACAQRIREREPDVVLKKLDGSGEMYLFHVRCAHIPERIAFEDKEKWKMGFRRAWELEPVWHEA